MQSLIPIWKKAPFIRIIIPFIIGLIIGRYTSFPIVALWGILFAAGGLSVAYNFISSKKRFLLRSVQGICINTIWLAAGILAFYYNDPGNNESWIGNQHENFLVYRIRITEPLSERQSTFKSTGEITSAYRLDSANNDFSAGKSERNLSEQLSSTTVKGSVLIYFRKDSSLSRIKNGSVILINKPPESIPNSSNPGGFDYQAYLELKGIHHQYFLSPADYLIDTTVQIPISIHMLESLKNKILGILDGYVPGNEASGLSKALLVGYKEDLDYGFLDMYSKTGVIHVIAISGLHLAVIYIILSRLFGIISGNRKRFSVIPVILGLWIFTLLAGAGASVCRSALMFTIIAIGETEKKKSNILNSLAASAFLLLLYDPFWLWDLGYQLSYAAVLSLVLTQKAIYNIMYISNRLLDELWKVSSVTLSAQVLTIPILLFNFHQFPVYFLFTNLVCVPVSSLALILELFLCAIFYIEPLAMLTGKLISLLLGFMTDVVIYFHQMPFASYGPIQISGVQTVLLYLFIIAVLSWLKYRHKGSFIYGGVAVLIFSILRSLSFYEHSNQVLLVIYHIPGTRAISIINGRHSVLISDSSLLKNHKKLEQYILPSFIKFRIKDYSQYDTGKRNYSLMYNKLDLHVIHQAEADSKIFWNSNGVMADSMYPWKSSGNNFSRKKAILLVGGYRSFNGENLGRDYNAELLITDGTVSRKVITSLQQQDHEITKMTTKADFKKLSSWYHTGQKGAFVMKLN